MTKYATRITRVTIIILLMYNTALLFFLFDGGNDTLHLLICGIWVVSVFLSCVGLSLGMCCCKATSIRVILWDFDRDSLSGVLCVCPVSYLACCVLRVRRILYKIHKSLMHINEPHPR